MWLDSHIDTSEIAHYRQSKLRRQKEELIGLSSFRLIWMCHLLEVVIEFASLTTLKSKENNICDRNDVFIINEH